MGARLLSVSQDSGADPLGWQSRVALLGLWGHAGMKRCGNIGNKVSDTKSVPDDELTLKQRYTTSKQLYTTLVQR